MNGDAQSPWRHWQIDVVGAAVCAALGVVAWVGAVAPVRAYVGEVAAARSALAQRQERAATLTAGARTLRDQVAVTRQALAQRPLQLQPAEQVNRRLAELSALAAKNAIEIADVRPGRVVPDTRYHIVPIELSGAGGFRACALFLGELRRTFPDVAVTSFDIIGTPGLRATASLRLRLSWFTRPTGGAIANTF